MSPEIQQLRQQLDRIESLLRSQNSDHPLDIDGAAAYTGYKKPYLYKLVHNRQIPHIKRGQKLMFYPSELNNWMQSGRRVTADDINTQADTYTALHPLKR